MIKRPSQRFPRPFSLRYRLQPKRTIASFAYLDIGHDSRQLQPLDSIDMRPHWVRPIDSPNGRPRRGFFAGLSDILTSRGPDYFIASGNARGPRAHEWARFPEYNRLNQFRSDDGYGHLFEDDPCCGRDKPGTPSWARRGRKRYDPVTRRYRDWCDDVTKGPRGGGMVARNRPYRYRSHYLANEAGGGGGDWGGWSGWESRPWKREHWMPGWAYPGEGLWSPPGRAIRAAKESDSGYSSSSGSRSVRSSSYLSDDSRSSSGRSWSPRSSERRLQW